MNRKYHIIVPAAGAAAILSAAIIAAGVPDYSLLPLQGASASPVHASAAAAAGSGIPHKRVAWPNVHASVRTDFNENALYPSIEKTAFIHPFAVVIGDCHIGKMVLVAPTAVCRGDEGSPIQIEDYSNIQDGVVLHALETTEDGRNLDGRRFRADGDRLLGNDTKFGNGYAIWVGERTSLAHGALVHGPAWIGNNTFVGMEAMVFNAKVGSNVAIGVSSTITGGVTIADNRFVPPGMVITTQEQADALPLRAGSSYESINKGVIHLNENLAEQYDQEHLEKLIKYREAEMEKGMWETGQSPPSK